VVPPLRSDFDVPLIPSLWEYGLLLPQHFNGGKPVPPDLRTHIEQLMLDQFRGFTVARGLDGAWLDPGCRRFDDCNDEYRLAVADEATFLAFAIEVGRLLEQFSVYVRCADGRAMILPTADDPVAICPLIHTTHYAVPPETVTNLLRLPGRPGPTGDWTLHFTYFDEDRRFVRIVLTAEPLPNDLTSTADGIAVVGSTGTRLQILGSDEGELARVETFLAAKLAQFAYSRRERGGHQR
jgi:hypothetical protein